MLQVKNSQGTIVINDSVIADVTSIIASNCFGIAGMAAKNVTEQIFALIKRDRNDKGISVTCKNNRISIDVHISVLYGVNIPAITESIAHKITYSVSEYVGFPVEKVNVFVDSIITR